MTRLLPLAPIALWVLIYPARMLLSHQRFATNAYDLSVFDYALWNLGQGTFVPFLGRSLWSDHAMPTLTVLLPIYWLSPGPTLLIVVQMAAVLVAALLLWRLTRDQLSPLLAAAVLLAFLFSRRSHSAVMSLFYLESLEPALMLAMVLAWQSKRWIWFGIAVALALGCKEDVAIYVACFGVLMWVKGDRRAAVATVAAAVCWLLIAITIVIPASRARDGLGAENPLWERRYPSSVTMVVGRVFSSHTIKEFLQLSVATGFVSIGAPQWLAVAVPGGVANLVAGRESQQSGLTGHYAWPLLPWLFVAAIGGARRLESRDRRLARVFAAVLIAYIVIDSPLWQSVIRGQAVSASEAAHIREALQAVPPGASLTATSHLVPQVPHRATIHTLGINEPSDATEYIALSAAGNAWPLAPEEVRMRIECFERDGGFERIGAGDPAIFRRVAAKHPLPTCGRQTAPTSANR